MAWVKNFTTVGLNYFASMFGATPNITRVVAGMTSITETDILDLTDVVDPIMIDDPANSDVATWTSLTYL